MDRITEDYRRHSLVVGRSQSEWLGVVWRTEGEKQTKAYSCEGPTKDEVLERLRAFVNESFKPNGSDRDTPPSGEEYVKAFQAIIGDLPDSYCAMLKAHYHAPDQTITADELADAAGYENYHPANLHYGTLGKMLYDALRIEPQTGSNGQPVYTFALATEVYQEDPVANWRWKLRPEVAFAIEELGLAT